MSTARVISIFSSKGGVGSTTLVANLAISLQDQFSVKAAVLELGAVDPEEVRLLGSTDIHFLSGHFTNESMVAVLQDLSSKFAYTFVDAGSSLGAAVLAAFERSHLIILITTPDVISIHRTNQALRQLDALNVPSRMVKVVLNRAESQSNFRSAEVKESLPVETIAEIPSDGRTVGLCLNQSQPFVRIASKARIAQAVKDWAKLLATRTDLYVEHVALDLTKAPVVESPAEVPTTNGSRSAAVTVQDPMILFKQRLHSQLVEQLDLKRFDLRAMNDPVKAKEIRERVEQVILNLIVAEKGFVPDPNERKLLVKELVDDLMGLGPLEDLLADPEITDILVNGPENVYIEKRGKLVLTSKRFFSSDQVLTVIERIIAPLGRRIDESTPMVDARLADGSRVNAVIPPLSIKGPMLSIRKFNRHRFEMDDLLRIGSISPAMATFLELCVVNRKNIIVSGGTGSGKTTLLNVISAFVPDDERIITIEDAAELRLAQRHWVALESRMQNVEGRGEVTIRQLFRNTLRMRPDRIVIGECRGDETLDMLQAMNTGHDGSLTTLHANSPQDVVSRLDSLILMSNVDLPVRAIREQIVSAIDLIVHTSRQSDGSRKVTHITQIGGMDEHESVMFHDLFLFKQTGVGPNHEVLGYYTATGKRPSFLSDLRARGVKIDDALFEPEKAPEPQP